MKHLTLPYPYQDMRISDPSKKKELEETMNIIKSYFLMNLHHIWAGFFILYIISYTAGSWSDIGSPSCDRDHMMSLPPSVSNPGRTERAPASQLAVPSARQYKGCLTILERARRSWSEQPLSSSASSQVCGGHQKATEKSDFLTDLVHDTRLHHGLGEVPSPHSHKLRVTLLHSLRASLDVAVLCCFMKVLGIKDK